MKFLKILCIFIFLTFPLGEIFRIDLGNNIAIRPQDALIGVTVVFGLIFLNYKSFFKTTFFKPIILFSSIGAFSLIVNSPSLNYQQFLASFLYLLRWVSYAFIYFIITRFDKSYKRLILILMFVNGLLILTAGYTQYFLYPNLRNLYYLGWDEHNYRMFSVYLDPNFAGAFFVLFFLFIVGLIHIYLRAKRRNYAIALVAISILTLAAVFLTYSRSAILMLVAGLSAYLILIGKKKYLLLLFIAITTIILFLTPTYNKENTNLLRTTSSFARVETYNNSLKIIKDHPFFGIGFNAYRYAQESYGMRKVKTKFPSHADAGVDNSFLFVLATTGILGLLSYLFMWKKILNRAFYIFKKKHNVFSILLISSSLGLFVNSFFINSLFFPSIMLWMWILIGMIEDC